MITAINAIVFLTSLSSKAITSGIKYTSESAFMLTCPLHCEGTLHCTRLTELS